MLPRMLNMNTQYPTPAPLNSKRLIAWHLRPLAQALELPTTGSPDLLRQCIEAAVDQDHEHQNVVVTVKESLKTECIVALDGLSRKQVRITAPPRGPKKPQVVAPSDFLELPLYEDPQPHVNAVHITDKGSVPQCVRVQIQGIPAYGLIDSGADITIIGGALFKKVATIARLKRRDLRPADKVPWTYDQRPLDEWTLMLPSITAL